jgi:putative transposase
MNLARSSYYYQPLGRRRADEVELVEHIEAIRARWPGYGYRRVTRQLAREGKCVNHKRVARILREHGLQARQPRAFVVTSDGKAPAPFPDLAKDCTPNGPDQLWVADLTYIRIVVGFVYAAVILDAWSRRVVGYAIARTMDVRLTCAALQAAVAARVAAGRMHPSFGQGVPVRRRGIPGFARGSRLARFYGTPRQSI